jgi:starvation-inducible DNA-binding protein
MNKIEYYLELQRMFASEFSFYLKAANFHWNVEGQEFYQLHLLLERIYGEVLESIDTYAEELRALQIMAPASLTAFSRLTYISDENQMLEYRAMLQELLLDSDMMALKFRDLFEVAETFGDHGLSNFLADRQDAHKKHSWMLRSQLK